MRMVSATFIRIVLFVIITLQFQSKTQSLISSKKSKVNDGVAFQPFSEYETLSIRNSFLGSHPRHQNRGHEHAVARVKRNQMNLQKLLQVSARRAHEKRSQPSASASYSRPSPSASYSRSRPSLTPTIYQITSTHHHPSKPTAIHTLDLNSVALPQSSSHPIHLQSSLSPECHDTELATQTSASLSVASSLPSTSSGNQALETSTWRIPIH